MNRRLFLNRAALNATAIGVSGWLKPAFAAEEAMSARHITIGNSIALTGPLGGAGIDHANGLRAAFAAVNKTGGIHGRELRLISKDDGYVAARTAANVKEMIDDGSAFAFISQIGTPNSIAMLPLIEKANIPLIGPITGSSALRKPEFKNVFHIRPSYTDEVTRMVQQINSMGLQNIAFIYLDNAFGKEVLKDAQRALGDNKIKAAGEFPLAFDGSNANEAVAKVLDSKAGAVFLAATGTGVTDFLFALRAKAGALPVVGMSVTFTDLTRLGKEKAQGLATAMVFPSPRSKKYVLVRNYDASMAASNLKASGGSALESWINAQVLIEGLRRAGRDLTRDKFRTALSGMRGYEVGELSLGFSNAAPFTSGLPVKLGVYGADFQLRG